MENSRKPNAISPHPKTSLQHAPNSGARERAVQAIEQLCHAWEAQAGVPLGAQYIAFLVKALLANGYDSTQHSLARVWIMYGDCARYKTLTLADFYPSEEKLKSLGTRFTEVYARDMHAAHQRGVKQGRDEARTEERRLACEDVEARADAMRAVDSVEISAERSRLTALAERLQKEAASLDERWRALHQTVRRLDRIRTMYPELYERVEQQAQTKTDTSVFQSVLQSLRKE